MSITKNMRRARNAGSAYSRSKPSRFDWLLWSAINKNTTKRNNLANVTQTGSTVNISGPVVSKYVQMTQFVENTTAFVRNADSIVQWTQPANTVITAIRLFFPSTTYAIGLGNDLGYEVGSTSSGAQVVTTVADEILDAAAATGSLTTGSLVNVTLVHPTQSATTLAVHPAYSGTSERPIFLNTTCTNTAAVTTPGTVRWIIDYLKVA